MPKPAIIAVVVLLLAAGGGVAAWMLWPDPEPDPEEDVAEDKDTGFTRDQTEELMRTIGYVQ